MALLLVGASSIGMAYGAKAQTTDSTSPTVVELFTSQGCSSCPTADALLKSYADRPGLLALSLSVDVWDYLGWRDTLANPKFTDRLRAYARNLGNGKIYTPQVVIEGRQHAKGGMRADIDRGIASAQAASAGKRVQVKAAIDGKSLQIAIPAAEPAQLQGPGTIWVAVVQRSVTVTVKRGENSGRELSYTNVVRDLIPVGTWSGAAMTVSLERAAIMRPGADGCAVILQSGTESAIIGASALLPM